MVELDPPITEKKEDAPKQDLSKEQQISLKSIPSIHSPTKIVLLKTDNPSLVMLLFLEMNNATEKCLIEISVLQDLIAAYDKFAEENEIE